jgi:phage baseplate assembly protein W
MTQPVTNLTATWLPALGIVLSWSAASDATTGSQYEIYVLEKVLSQVPTWVLVGTSKPYASSSNVPSVSGSVLQIVSPQTNFTFSLAAITALTQPGYTVALNSFAFNVVHVSSAGIESTGVSISAFTQPIHTVYGSPHLSNGVSIDSFGQFVVTPQDSYSEISDSVALLLGTVLGQRSVVPDYGIEDLPLSEINIGEIENAIGKWEPRANATVNVTYDGNNNATLSVQVQGGN